jgi:hypothetical protein
MILVPLFHLKFPNGIRRWRCRNFKWAALAAARAPAVLLDRRARHRAVGTKYAAIACSRFQSRAATFAVIEKLTGIERHLLGSLKAALRAGQRRFQLHPFTTQRIFLPSRTTLSTE